MVLIQDIRPGSIADRLGIHPGDTLISVNGQSPKDILDYRFLMSDEEIRLFTRSQDGSLRESIIYKEFDEDIGLEFEDALFDGIRRCHNRCIFCFVDQLPPGLRESLYVKDDDYRLSFLHGNFISLTNLTDDEISSIKRMRLSPLYVSVHSTNPDVRAKMMGNHKAGKIMAILRDLTEAGIEIHTQVVLCKGINDGPELDRTIADLARLWPGVRSCGVVPVGLTRHRDRLANISPFTWQDAASIIQHTMVLGRKFLEDIGTRFIFIADEFFLLAGVNFPKRGYYEDFCQKENGIGIARDFMDSCQRELRRAKRLIRKGILKIGERWISVATGVSGAKVLAMETPALQEIEGLHLKIYAIPNRLFGPLVTVSGLVAGGDIISALKGQELGDELLIPKVMLRYQGDKFLDDTTIEDISDSLGVKVKCVEAGGKSFIRAVLGEEYEE